MDEEFTGDIGDTSSDYGDPSVGSYWDGSDQSVVDNTENNPLGDAGTAYTYGDNGTEDTANAADGTFSDTSDGTGSYKDNSNVDPTADPSAQTGTGSVGSKSPGSGMSLGKPQTNSGPQQQPKQPVQSVQAQPRPSYLPQNPRYTPRTATQAQSNPRGLAGTFPITNANANTGWQPTGAQVTAPASNPIYTQGQSGMVNPQLLLYGAIALALFAIVKH